METRTGGWICALLAFLACRIGTALWPASGPSAEVLRRAEELEGSLDPARMSARELRAVPGVGETLALAIVRAREAAERPLDWEEVEGIGPAIAARIRAWFAARGIAAQELPPAPGARRSRYDVGVTPASFLRVHGGWSLAICMSAAACGSDPAEARAGKAREEDAQRTAEARQESALEPAAASAREKVSLRSFVFQAGGAKVHALEAGPSAGRGVLLLHGARFRAATWEELGTLAVLGGRGYRVVALDLPGYGESAPSEAAPADFLEACLDALALERAVIVSPSMSGTFSLPLLARARERFAGFVPIAPAGGAELETLAGYDVPTLILWGEKDDMVPVAGAALLAAKLPGARVEVLPGASHPCYLDSPERFHELLLGFLAELDRR